MAVEILRRWSAPARALSGDVRLFQYKRLGSDKVVFFRVDKYLGLFVAFLSLTPLPDGSFWKFTAHQFRRFFAILYFWRYKYGDLAALSYQLRHFDPAMTQIYVTERETGAIFRHVSAEFTTSVLTEAALGQSDISGPFGERFKLVARRLRQHYRRLLKVVSPKLVQKIVERYVRNSGRRLKAMLWGYCFCGPLPHQLSSAQCLQGVPANKRIKPDFSRSTPSVCATYPHHLTEISFEPFVRADIEGHERAAADPNNGPIVREASREYVEGQRRHYNRCFKNSKPVEVLK
jgi:hypothetical protein